MTAVTSSPSCLRIASSRSRAETSHGETGPAPKVRHQARDRATGDCSALAVQLPPDLADAIDLQVFIPAPPDFWAKLSNPLVASRQLCRISPAGGTDATGGRGDGRHTADRSNPIRAAMLIDAQPHFHTWRPSSAWARKADACGRAGQQPRLGALSRTEPDGVLAYTSFPHRH